MESSINLTNWYKISVTLPLLLLMLTSQAQQQPLFTIFKTYPLNLFYNHEINVAVEKNFNQKHGIEILLGTALRDKVYYIPVDPTLWQYDWNVSDLQPCKSILTRISYKRHIGQKPTLAGRSFLSPQLFLKYAYFDHIFYEDTYDGIYQAYLDMKKFQAALQFLIGKQKISDGRKLVTGFYVGAGLRYNYYEKKTIDSYIKYDWEEEFTHTHHNQTSNYHFFMPTLHLGISIGIIKYHKPQTTQ